LMFGDKMEFSIHAVRRVCDASKTGDSDGR
jgi:hypothetical protein